MNPNGQIYNAGYSGPLNVSRWNVGGLLLIKTVFNDGEWYGLKRDAPTKQSELASLHFVPRGRFPDRAGVLPDIEAGWISRYDDTVIPAGETFRVSAGESELWCVYSNFRQRRVDFVSVNVILPNETLSLDGGERLFIIDGAVNVAQTGATGLSGECYVIGAGGRQIVATTKTTLIHWPPA